MKFKEKRKLFCVLKRDLCVSLHVIPSNNKKLFKPLFLSYVSFCYLTTWFGKWELILLNDFVTKRFEFNFRIFRTISTLFISIQECRLSFIAMCYTKHYIIRNKINFQMQTLVMYIWNCRYVVRFGLVPQKSFRMAAFNIHEPLINTSFLSMCLHKYLDDFLFSFSSIFCGILTSKENRQKAYSKGLINLKRGILHHRFIKRIYQNKIWYIFDAKILNKCIFLIRICYKINIVSIFRLVTVVNIVARLGTKEERPA